jgi:NAD(P)-dependent dehydrogenase (short-subunit alcohol dehydrogenase family)
VLPILHISEGYRFFNLQVMDLYGHVDLQVIDTHGHIDLLVNNAGCGATGPVVETDLKLFKEVFDVNVFGAVAVSQAFVNHITKFQVLIF